MTWNPTLFPDNATNIVELTYITADQQLAWSSPDVANIRGYVNVFMDKDWLLGASGNDTNLGMEQIDPASFVFGVELRGLGMRCFLSPACLLSLSRLPLR